MIAFCQCSVMIVINDDDGDEVDIFMICSAVQCSVV